MAVAILSFEEANASPLPPRSLAQMKSDSDRKALINFGLRRITFEM